MRLVALVLALALLSPAAPAAARVPDGLEVTGWVLLGTGSTVVARNAGGLTTLSVAGVSVTASGGGVARPGRDHERLLATAHRHGLAAELLVSNYSNRSGDFDPVRLHRLLSSDARIHRVASRLAGFVADQGWDGVNVDLERVRAADGDGLVRLVEELQDAMPAERTVSIDISAATSVRAYRDRGYRLAGLAAAADVVDVMTYDLHGPWSGPGPVGALGWQRDALDALLSVVPAGRVQLGVAGYGYTWPRRGTGHAVTDRGARALVHRDGATAHWRPGPGEWTATLSNGTRLWWSDRRSYARRVALAREYGVRGLAVWRIGSADTLR
ncbi:glycosyl hydrolase family 18 protein [Nocardioides sp. URHA0032]|uniref:glycosyl hydrolase family 18 protein n=1 Tax=Nocardioides sp. URHA0032 TaxID=1380388 RepID=UPI000490AD1B|nr:glycosyl hydrolase family 18 protein [Nocardioides sp. URHA0032]